MSVVIFNLLGSLALFLYGLYTLSEDNNLGDNLRKNHYNRFKKGICRPEAGPIYLEILMNLERISELKNLYLSGKIRKYLALLPGTGILG